jgi:hypothetical protein
VPKPVRYAEAKINFDPMTDTMTNVVGAMIRLVMLVLLITSAAKFSNLVAPPGGPRADSSGRTDDKPLRPLLVQIKNLKSLIRDVQAKTAAVEEEIPALQQRVEKLRQNTAVRRKDAAT